MNNNSTQPKSLNLPTMKQVGEKYQNFPIYKSPRIRTTDSRDLIVKNKTLR